MDNTFNWIQGDWNIDYMSRQVNVTISKNEKVELFNGFYYESKLTLLDLLLLDDSECLFISKGRIDLQDVFVKRDHGLYLHLTKDTYERLGLIGKPSSLSFKKTKKIKKFVVELDLSQRHGKLYDRFKTCFTEIITDVFEFWIASHKQQVVKDVSGYPFQMAHEFTLTEQNGLVMTPPLSNLDLSSFKDQESVLMDLLEWKGLMDLNCDVISVQDLQEFKEGKHVVNHSMDPFLSLYSPPQDSIPIELKTISISGYFHPNYVSFLLKNIQQSLHSSHSLSWAVVSILGYRDDPLFLGKEHGRLEYGENDVIVFMNSNGSIPIQVCGR